MTSCRVCDRLDVAVWPTARPIPVQAFEVARTDPLTDGIDDLFTDFSVDRRSDHHRHL
jgi:hypothetical protein